MKVALRFIVKNFWKTALFTMVLLLIVEAKWFCMFLGVVVIIGEFLGCVFKTALKLKGQKYFFGIIFLSLLFLGFISFFSKMNWLILSIIYCYMMLGALYAVKKG